MTPLLFSLLLLLTLYAVYFAARIARLDAPAAEFLDGGGRLPGWAAMFILPGLAIAGLGLEQHLWRVSTFGLSASHIAVGFVLFAVAALLIWNRLWYVTRIAGLATPGEALGRFYGSIALRVIILALTLLFALPFSANLLSFAAQLLEQASNGSVPRIAWVWLLAISLAVPAIIGGWRAAILVLAMHAVLLALLLPGSTILAEILIAGPGFPAQPIPVAEGVLADRIPGVVQYVGGIGKKVLPVGIFSAVAIGSSILALLGILFSPASLYLGQTVRAGATLGVSSVWLTGGLAGGVLVLGAPLLATRMADGPMALAETLYAAAPLAGAALVLMLVIATLFAVSFFVTGGVLIFTRELIIAYLLPDLSHRAQRFSARVALGFTFFFVALLASFFPLLSAVTASVALPLAVQMLPAFLGLGFLRWISRGAILAGMTLGMLIVVFTEPLGLIVFEALFVELPWGRWPLTIHSAAWGLTFNLLIVLLSAVVTLNAPDRFERDRLHDSLLAATRVEIGGRGLFWSLMLVWGFLAYGPGAVLGNTFFSDPIFSPVAAALGIPSLWVWQILFWLFGVVLVWWLAYRVGFGNLSETHIEPIELGQAPPRRSPDWLAAGLARVAGNKRR
ncbi:hypothetical protein [Pseudohoeflea coraliihabitans]|uniref:Uncharacterized protein n=1 Tax=Pseudohoeflea coraliihabitans TaxID=2860393 RepID=A0ABS6WTL7_9HYPH|nr:hypothetical protein [Pseudohoeflea sp. DP4N28-3]MBW3098958.1 hypothetical protein [Pseudohoeflea sp. DP4N28-3]